MTAESDYLAARMRVIEARSRAAATAREIQVRLAPRTIAHDAWSSVKTRSEALADRGVETARTHPRAAAGAGATALLLLLRRPICRGVRRVFRRRPKSEPVQS